MAKEIEKNGEIVTSKNFYENILHHISLEFNSFWNWSYTCIEQVVNSLVKLYLNFCAWKELREEGSSLKI